MSAPVSESVQPVTVLLGAYRRNGSERAFAGIVQRYAGLVYSTALRKTGEAAAAQDVAQNVFAALAKRGPSLPEDERLGGWLHRRACMAASDYLKSERRRRAREQVAADLHDRPVSGPQMDLLADLDDCLTALPRGDREVVTLRYLEGRSLREVSEALGISEDAAQKRVSRALERMRSRLSRGGAAGALSVAGIVAALRDPAQAAGSEVPSAILQSVRPMVGGTAARVWRWTAMAAPIAAGAGAVLLCSAPSLQRVSSHVTTGPATRAVGRPAKASVRMFPSRPAAPAIEEIVQQLVALCIAEPGDYAPPATHYRQLALAQSVAVPDQPAALRRFLELLEEADFSLTGNRGRFLYATWLESLAQHNVEALYELMLPPAPSWFVQRANSHLHIGLRALPQGPRDALCRRILDDAYPSEDAARSAAGWLGMLDSDGFVDVAHREQYLEECLEGLHRAKHRWWAEAAIRFVESEEDFLRCATALSECLRGDALRRTCDALCTEWAKKSWRDLLTWGLDQPPSVRSLALGRAFPFPDSRDEVMEAADMIYDHPAGAPEMIGIAGNRSLTDPDTWLPWLEAHPDLVRNGATEVSELLNRRFMGDFISDNTKREEYVKTPAEPRVGPWFRVWKNADPAGVASFLESSTNDVFKPLREALRALP